jgi:hypothetical protein
MSMESQKNYQMILSAEESFAQGVALVAQLRKKEVDRMFPEEG